MFAWFIIVSAMARIKFLHFDNEHAIQPSVYQSSPRCLVNRNQSRMSRVSVQQASQLSASQHAIFLPTIIAYLACADLQLKGRFTVELILIVVAATQSAGVPSTAKCLDIVIS